MADNPESGEPNARTNQLARTAANPAERLVDHADLTALTLVQLVVENVSAKQALFSGTLFRDCTFRRCDFKRADFEGSVFESCIFEHCDFSVADFRSVDAVRTRFVDCTFEEGSTRSCRFLECTFEQSRLELHSFCENRLEDSSFSQCSFRRSTSLHCDFIRTRFEKTDLADCTAQFHMFEECIFVDTRINAEAVGLTFGLTRENLSVIGLVWRGIGIETDVGIHDLPADLVTTYMSRGWFFAAAILKLNFSLTTAISALNEVFSAVESSAKSSLPLKSDEVRFLARVVERLSADGRMPFIGIVRGLEVTVDCADLNSRRDADAFKSLYHALKDAEHSELIAIERTIAPLQEIGSNGTLLVSFVFSEEPPTSFHHWLDQLHADGFLAGPAPRFLRAERGSYVELFYLAIGTLGSVLICLSLVARIVDRLIDIRARSQILFGHGLPAVIKKRALQPATVPSQAIIDEFRKYLELASGPKAGEFLTDVQDFSQRLTRVEISAASEQLSG